MFSWVSALEDVSNDPNPGQAVLRLLGPQDILIVAPAGCGKTEALAERASALVGAAVVRRSQRLLALTFSNRARDNLRSRVRDKIGHQYWRRVSVTNLHGFAARVIRAHGAAAGVNTELVYPDRGWRRRTLRDLGVTWQQLDQVDACLRDAKQGPFDDEEVLKRLRLAGNHQALAFQERVVTEDRMDFDDVLRHAQRILEIPEVAHLYQMHFPVVLVDEVQDLTPQQLDIVLAVGGTAITAAADPAQGIYSFAGANLDHVLSTLRNRQPAEVEFNLCYRSAPPVLEVVNALAEEQGATRLECANPDTWPEQGRVAMLRRRTLQEEASALLDAIAELQLASPNYSIGVVARRRSRREEAEREARTRGLDFELWDVATHNRAVVRLLRRHLSESLSASTSEHQLVALELECRAALEPEDVETHYELTAACESIRDLLEQGLSLKEAIATCRETSAEEEPVGPGIHFINGHVAKGQQFDWVIVLGMEEGHVPDFRATESSGALAEELRVLHVMASRACIGLAFTFTTGRYDKYGRWHANAESRWLAAIASCVTEEW